MHWPPSGLLYVLVELGRCNVETMRKLIAVLKTAAP